MRVIIVHNHLSARDSYPTTGQPHWNGGTHQDPTEIATPYLQNAIRVIEHSLKNSPFTAVQRVAREARLRDLKAELQRRS